MIIIGAKTFDNFTDAAEHIASEPHLQALRTAILRAIIQRSPKPMIYDYRWLRRELERIHISIDK